MVRVAERHGRCSLRICAAAASISSRMWRVILYSSLLGLLVPSCEDDPTSVPDPCAIDSPDTVKTEIRTIARGRDSSIEHVRTTLTRLREITEDNQRCAIVSKVASCCVLNNCSPKTSGLLASVVEDSCSPPIPTDPAGQCVARCDSHYKARTRIQERLYGMCMDDRRHGCANECLVQHQIKPRTCKKFCSLDRKLPTGETNEEYWARKCRGVLDGVRLGAESEHGVCKDDCLTP